MIQCFNLLFLILASNQIWADLLWYFDIVPFDYLWNMATESTSRKHNDHMTFIATVNFVYFICLFGVRVLESF